MRFSHLVVLAIAAFLTQSYSDAIGVDTSGSTLKLRKLGIIIVPQEQARLADLCTLMTDGSYVRLESQLGKFAGPQRFVTDDGFDFLDIAYNRLAETRNGKAMNEWYSDCKKRNGPLYRVFAVRGVYYISKAWDARGNGYANTVAQVGAQRFALYLDSAEHDLRNAFSAFPQEPYSPANLVRVAMGKNYDIETTSHFFHAALKADPYCQSAYSNMLTYSLPKWHGSREEAYRIAMDAFKLRDKNPVLAGILGKYHWNIGSGDSIEHYCKDLNNWNEIEQAYNFLLSYYPNSIKALATYNSLAYSAGRFALSRDLYIRVGNKYNDDSPLYKWGYYYRWGTLERNLDHHEEALVQFTRALEADSSKCFIYLDIGNEYGNLLSKPNISTQSKRSLKEKQILSCRSYLQLESSDTTARRSVENWLKDNVPQIDGSRKNKVLVLRFLDLNDRTNHQIGNTTNDFVSSIKARIGSQEFMVETDKIENSISKEDDKISVATSTGLGEIRWIEKNDLVMTGRLYKTVSGRRYFQLLIFSTDMNRVVKRYTVYGATTKEIEGRLRSAVADSLARLFSPEYVWAKEACDVRYDYLSQRGTQFQCDSSELTDLFKEPGRCGLITLDGAFSYSPIYIDSSFICNPGTDFDDQELFGKLLFSYVDLLWSKQYVYVRLQEPFFGEMSVVNAIMSSLRENDQSNTFLVNGLICNQQPTARPNAPRPARVVHFSTNCATQESGRTGDLHIGIRQSCDSLVAKLASITLSRLTENRSSREIESFVVSDISDVIRYLEKYYSLEQICPSVTFEWRRGSYDGSFVEAIVDLVGYNGISCINLLPMRDALKVKPDRAENSQLPTRLIRSNSNLYELHIVRKAFGNSVPVFSGDTVRFQFTSTWIDGEKLIGLAQFNCVVLGANRQVVLRSQNVETDLQPDTVSVTLGNGRAGKLINGNSMAFHQVCIATRMLPVGTYDLLIESKYFGKSDSLRFSVSMPQQIPVAVYSLNGINVDKEVAAVLTDRLRKTVGEFREYNVIERDMMNEILREQAFQQTGCTDDACAIQVGRLLNVKMIFSGSIAKIGDLYTLSIRLINLETGAVIKEASLDRRCGLEQLLSLPSEAIRQMRK